MPTCQRCDSLFPNRTKIDGTWKNLSSRKYCLECSPFGQHNTVKIHIEKKTDAERTCATCGKSFVVNRSKNNKGYTCGACHTTARRVKAKEELIKYKGGACCMCGYSKNHASLDFHHLDPAEKDFQVSRKHGVYSMERLKAEVDKCILVCKNCHMEIHYGHTPFSSMTCAIINT